MMARFKLKYVSTDIDRHGNVRHYFRRGREPKTRLRGLPGSPEFMAAYQAALASVEVLPAASTNTSIRLLMQMYVASLEFKNLAVVSQRRRRRILEKLCDKAGDRRYDDIRPRNIRKFRDNLQHKPGAATHLVKALRALFKFAVDNDLMDSNPARDIAYLRKRGEGFHTWTVEEVQQYEDTWPIGSKQRLGFALLLFTGARRSDVVTFGRQMV